MTSQLRPAPYPIKLDLSSYEGLLESLAGAYYPIQRRLLQEKKKILTPVCTTHEPPVQRPIVGDTLQDPAHVDSTSEDEEIEEQLEAPLTQQKKKKRGRTHAPFTKFPWANRLLIRYFDPVSGDDEVCCTHCYDGFGQNIHGDDGIGRWVKQKRTNTTSSCFLMHLRTKHGLPATDTEFEALCRSHSLYPKTSNGKRKAIGSIVVGEIPLWKRRKPGSRIHKATLRRLMLEFVLENNQSLGVVESPSFRNLMGYLDEESRQYVISRCTLGRDLEVLFRRKRRDLKIILQQHVRSGGKVSLTNDLWTSGSQKTFFSITAHFIQNGKLVSHLLAFRHQEGRHNHSWLANVIASTCERFGIQDSIRAITADNAEVNTKAFKELERSHRLKGFTVKDCTVRCMAHVLNLTAQAILKVLKADKETFVESELADIDIPEPLHQNADDNLGEAAIAAIFRIARKIIAKIRQSNILWEELQSSCQTQNIPPLRPILDCPTRWLSTRAMLTRLRYLSKAINKICTEQEELYKLNLNLDRFDWAWLKRLEDILAIFDDATVAVSGDHYPTMAFQLPQYWLIALSLKNKAEYYRDINDTLHEACRKAYDKLNEYHCDTDTLTIPRISTLLDPRLGLSSLQNLGWDGRQLRLAQDTLKRVFRRDYAPNGEDSAASSEESSPPEMYMPTPEERLLFNCPPSVVEEYGDNLYSWQSQVTRYLSLAASERPGINKCPISWWSENKSFYPDLARMAIDYLAIPGSSVPSERVFSRAGDLISKKRNRLSTDTAEFILCTRYWLGLPEATRSEVEAVNEWDKNIDEINCQYYIPISDEWEEEEAAEEHELFVLDLLGPPIEEELGNESE